MTIDPERLLAPLTVEDAVGRNLRDDGTDSTLYYQIKDARSAARLAERQADADTERGAPAAEWRTVHELAQRILAEASKDLEVAVWLVEAALRLDGFAGLRSSLAVLGGLVERYWATVHSLDDEDLSTKVAPIAGLNGVGAEGSLIQPMRLAPLTAPADGAPAGLWHYMVMRRRGAASPEATLLTHAVRASGAKDLVAIYTDVSESHRLFTALTARLDTLCGPDAPPSSAIRNVLEEAMDAMRDVARDALADVGAEAPPPEPVAPPPHAAAGAAEPQAAQAPAPLPAGPQPLRTRDEALRELARIAAYFREYEPNSPTAYSLETVIRRARLPLTDLLVELIPEESSRKTYLDMAGIRPAAP